MHSESAASVIVAGTVVVVGSIDSPLYNIVDAGGNVIGTLRMVTVNDVQLDAVNDLTLDAGGTLTVDGATSVNLTGGVITAVPTVGGNFVFGASFSLSTTDDILLVCVDAFRLTSARFGVFGAVPVTKRAVPATLAQLITALTDYGFF